LNDITKIMGIFLGSGISSLIIFDMESIIKKTNQALQYQG